MTVKREDIQIRDPFIVTVKEEGVYYMYGTTDKDCWENNGIGFDAYFSKDLENWEGPVAVFRPDNKFWGRKNFWAPEVYRYNGGYYMFASFIAEGVRRGTQSFVSAKPLGTFVANSEGTLTPWDWDCLDGTLYVDDEGAWMIFCHEWVQIGDGSICAMRLNKDLSRAISEPVELFRASSSPWAQILVLEHLGLKGYITDGPFMHNMPNGELIMLWSSFRNQRYALGIARSSNGKVTGPWVHDPEPVYTDDGGHGMLFNRFDGQLMLSIHKPNNTPLERPLFISMVETNCRIFVGI